MTLGVILLVWPILTWLGDRRRASRAVPVAASAGAAVVDREGKVRH